MKLLHVNCNYIGSTLHQMMVEELHRRGHENRVFVPVYDKNKSVIEPKTYVNVCECFRRWDRLFFDYKQHKILKALKKDIAAEDGFELIHAHTLFTDGNCARKISQKQDVPYIVTVRNTDVNAFFKYMPHLRRRGIRILRDAAAVVFISDAYRKQVFQKYIPHKYWDEIRNKTVIIPNGIDTFWFSSMLEKKSIISKKQGIRLLYVGRIDRNKNIRTIQKAMDLLMSEGYELLLTVVGSVQDEREYALIKNNRYTKFMPAMTKEKLIEVYKEADIFVMPSFTETFGLVYAEAMSQGLPVIYSEKQGFDEQFPEGEAGYHVSPYSPASVAEGISKIIDEYERISGQVAHLARKFNWKEISVEYERVYTDALK